MQIIRPPRPEPGAKVALVVPASPITDQQLQRAISNIKNLGLNPVVPSTALRRKGYLAGTDAQRAAELNAAFANPAHKAVFCLRGGYGTMRLLPMLNYTGIRQNPKLLVGFSDITALQCALYRHAGVASLHGPTGASELTPYAQEQLRAQLFGHPPMLIRSAPADQPVVLRAGRACGTLLGGNLSLLAALCGTPYEPNFDGAILFLEEVGEKPYRVDRLLTQLLLSGKIQRVAGIVLGQFHACQATDFDLTPAQSLSLHEVLQDRLLPLNVPIIADFSFGHVPNNASLPFGVRALLDTNNPNCLQLEPTEVAPKY